MALETTIVPRPPYSLALSARLRSDATRVFREGVLTMALSPYGEWSGLASVSGWAAQWPYPMDAGGLPFT